MRFFTRFRSALSQYEEGVHDLGLPATEKAVAEAEEELGRKLPLELRDFLLQWNGGYLFHDEVALFGVEGARDELRKLAHTDDGLWIGETATARLFLDERGRVLALDDETDGRHAEGSELERWLDATMAREGVLFDRDGEYREEAFDGEGLSERALRKRSQLAIKADPQAPAWHEESAALLVEEGQPDKAMAALERAVAGAMDGDVALADAWMALGQLRRTAGKGDAAVAFVHAARALGDPGEAAYAWAQASRAATGEDEKQAHARQVVELAPEFVAEQRAAARHLVEEGDLDGAVERLELALSIAPDDKAARELLSHTRARRALRPT